KLDGSPRFGEPLSPPPAAFAAANRAAGLSDGSLREPLPRVARLIERRRLPWANMFRAFSADRWNKLAKHNLSRNLS
ncbi:MAG: hypothetical protein LBP75_04425, partial [Planctomycetota bacterium]|nr:hypothetical protein [Planctomycetota bacterium]